MEFWSREGRPKLIAALEAACDAVQGDFAAALQQHDEDRQKVQFEELDTLRSAAARADYLEKENRALLQEIEHLRRKYATKPVKAPPSCEIRDVIPISFNDPAPGTRPALAEISANSKVRPLSAASSAFGSDERSKLEKECLRLHKESAAYQERYQETRRKGQEYREARDGWQTYSESLERKLKGLEKKLQRRQTPRNQSLAPSAAPVGVVNNGALSGRTAIGSSFMSDPGSETGSATHEDAAAQLAAQRAVSTPATTTPRHLDGVETGHENRVDEETEDEAEEACALPPIPPDVAAGFAVVIKEEPSSDPVIISERCVRKRKHTDEDPGKPESSRRIKSEHNISSDPVITADISTFSPHESIDLDEDQRGMPTPRKQRFREDWAMTPREDKVPLELLHTSTRPSAAIVHTPTPAQGTNPIRPAPSGLSPRKSARAHNDSRVFIRPDWNLGAAIADVAEDTFDKFHSARPEGRGEASIHLTPTRGRLHSLLHQKSPEPSATVLRPTRQGQGSRNPDLDRQTALVFEPPQGPSHHRETPTKASSAVASPSILIRKPLQDKSNLPKPSRLRDRPMAELRVEDFKVNPKSNNGYKHAFDEVVRNKDERAELAGCIDPNCCGKKFRAIAESELSAGGPGVLSRVADTKMLENYMGDEAHRLVDMTREERQDVWLKAKTQELADKHGRHRHRFTRKPSPPGYWDTDFPSTQDIEQRKAEGERLERIQVEERWREAMRGGRWVFRDE